jgi:hypothetical protein
MELSNKKVARQNPIISQHLHFDPILAWIILEFSFVKEHERLLSLRYSILDRTQLKCKGWVLVVDW